LNPGNKVTNLIVVAIVGPFFALERQHFGVNVIPENPASQRELIRELDEKIIVETKLALFYHVIFGNIQ
jgi:hypothetical protein